jgi:hypothetical protein
MLQGAFNVQITTIYGDRDDADFKRVDGKFEDDNELTTWVEYWDQKPDGDVLVHRSVHVHLKQAVFPVQMVAGDFA